MDPGQLLGQTFGPHLLRVAVDKVADFVDVTGDDPDRWADTAPPGFAAVALFVVAPDLLDQLADRSVIHGEQTFKWHEPIYAGGLLEVTGRVSKARERGGVHFVGFELVAEADERLVLEGTSLFLISGESIPGSAEFERHEPPHSYMGEVRPGQLAASRADLVRYAAATRDWNPVHWDHDAAVVAGLPGIVVHGLLQTAWALGAVTRQVDGKHPVEAARVRFRNPLLPARPVDVTVERGGSIFDAVVADESTTYVTARIEASDE